MPLIAPQRPSKDADGLRWASVSFDNLLDSTETLSGTPEVTEPGGSTLTIANVANSTAELEINGEDVAAGRAVRFTVDGGTTGDAVVMRVIGYSNSSPPQKMIGQLVLIIT